MLRRLRLRESVRAVAKGLGVSRNTVCELATWFEAESLLAGGATAGPIAADIRARRFSIWTWLTFGAAEPGLALLVGDRRRKVPSIGARPGRRKITSILVSK